MLKKILTAPIILSFSVWLHEQQPLKDLVAENMKPALDQNKILANYTPADSMPRSFDPEKNYTSTVIRNSGAMVYSQVLYGSFTNTQKIN